MTVADTHLYFSVYVGPRPAALTVQRSEERAMPREELEGARRRPWR
jgi:hypothetical protein